MMISNDQYTVYVYVYTYTYMYIWLVVEPYPSEKYQSVWCVIVPIYGKTTSVPNHQPVEKWKSMSLEFYHKVDFNQNMRWISIKGVQGRMEI